MTSTTHSAASGCFSGIVRRLLCNGNPQTHPSSDHVAEPSTTEFRPAKIEPKTRNEAKLQVEAPTGGGSTPGVVARLMGLDSLPETNWYPNPKSAVSVTRSRSVNFMEYLLEFDLTPGRQSQHRRVRTSVSFREVPTLSNTRQNHDFLVISMDDVDETKGMESKLRKSDVGFGEVKQKREERNKNKETKRDPVVPKKEHQGKNNKKISKFKDEPRKVSHKHVSKLNKSSTGAKVAGFVNRKSTATSSKMKIAAVNPVNQKEAPRDCSSSESSSPVSVLEVNDFDIYDVTLLTEDADTRSVNSNLKQKSSLRASNFNNPSPHSTAILNSDDVQFRAINKTDYESVETQYFRELVAKIIMMTEEDMKQTKWMTTEVLKYDDVEEICSQIGRKILDLMLYQVVDELMGTSHASKSTKKL